MVTTTFAHSVIESVDISYLKDHMTMMNHCEQAVRLSHQEPITTFYSASGQWSHIPLHVDYAVLNTTFETKCWFTTGLCSDTNLNENR